MPRRPADKPREVTALRDMLATRSTTDNTVTSVGFSDAVSKDGRTVVRQPVNIRTQPLPDTQQGPDDGAMDDGESPFLGMVTQIMPEHLAPPRKARRNNFFVSTVRLLFYLILAPDSDLTFDGQPGSRHVLEIMDRQARRVSHRTR